MAILTGFSASTKSSNKIWNSINTNTTAIAKTNNGMNSLVDKFFDGTLTDDGYKELYAALRAKKEVSNVDEPSCQEYRSVRNIDTHKGKVRVTLDDDSILLFDPDGTMWGTPSKVEVKWKSEDFKEIWKYGVALLKKDSEKLRQEMHVEKTRYVHTTNKKMFVSGLIIGRQGG